MGPARASSRARTRRRLTRRTLHSMTPRTERPAENASTTASIRAHDKLIAWSSSIYPRSLLRQPGTRDCASMSRNEIGDPRAPGTRVQCRIGGGEYAICSQVARVETHISRSAALCPPRSRAFQDRLHRLELLPARQARAEAFGALCAEALSQQRDDAMLCVRCLRRAGVREDAVNGAAAYRCSSCRYTWTWARPDESPRSR